MPKFLFEVDRLIVQSEWNWKSQLMQVPMSDVIFATDIGSPFVFDTEHPPTLMTNYTKDEATPFSRQTFHPYPAIISKPDKRCLYRVRFHRPGSYQFYFCWSSPSSPVELSWKELGFELDTHKHAQGHSSVPHHAQQQQQQQQQHPSIDRQIELLMTEGVEAVRSNKVQRLGLFTIVILPKLEVPRLPSSAPSNSEDFPHNREFEEVPLEALSVQTLLTKFLGPHDRWFTHAAHAKDLEFSMLHFSPVQQLGESNSAYCILDHQTFTPQLSEAGASDEKADEQQKRGQLLKTLVDRFEHELGLLSITDVVWNHTAANTPWLGEHPEATYNVKQFPHLRPAFELDLALKRFSASLAASSVIIETAHDVESVLQKFQHDVLSDLKLWQYFVLDVEAEVQLFRSHLIGTPLESAVSLFEPKMPHSHHAFCSSFTPKCVYDSDTCERFGRRVYTSCALAIFGQSNTTGPSRSSSANPPSLTPLEIGTLCTRYRRALEAINSLCFKKYDHDEKEILQNLRNVLNYERVDPHGPRKGLISPTSTLVGHYFTQVSPVPDLVAVEGNADRFLHTMANAGWVWNSNDSRTFALPTVESEAWFLQDQDFLMPNCVNMPTPTSNPVPALTIVDHGEPVLTPVPSSSSSSSSSSSQAESAVKPNQPTIETASVGKLSKTESDLELARSQATNLQHLTEEAFFTSEAARCSVYFKRQLVVWTDCVKLNFGNTPADNPWLWAYMKEYTEKMASIFHGFRLDNCHSTALPVAQYLIDCARRVRPNLYLTAELFSGSHDVDIAYCNALGLTSLIREAMQSGSPSDLGSLVKFCSGYKPIASLRPDRIKVSIDSVIHSKLEDEHHSHSHVIQSSRDLTELLQQLEPAKTIFHITPSDPRPLFLDCSHDNLVPAQKRTAHDCLPNTALVSFSTCAVGSTRGYDELVPKKLDVVTESRLYRHQLLTDESIFPCRRLLNRLHRCMSLEGFTELHVQQHGDIFQIVRHHPEKHIGYYLICHAAFSSDKLSAFRSASQNPNHHLNPQYPSITFEGRFVEEFFSAKLSINTLYFQPDPEVINGLESILYFRSYQAPDSSLYGIQKNRILLKNFPPGSVVVFKAEQLPEHQKLITELSHLIDDPSFQSTNAEQLSNIDASHLLVQNESHSHSQNHNHHYGHKKAKSLQQILDGLDLIDLNFLLFRCDSEERDYADRGVYVVPGYGPLLYAGIASVAFVFRTIARKNNDMHHPIVVNLREGNWLMEFLVDRLNQWAPLKALKQWLEYAFQLVRQLPRYLVPKYFDSVISLLYHNACKRAFTQMPLFVQSGNHFVRSLALTSVQLIGLTRSAALKPLSSTLLDENSQPHPVATMAAGLPFFSTGFMRNWGRDTFIAMRGLMLVTGRFAEARETIFQFATVLRHGLIPNLLGDGTNPRYNARDATWWFLQSLQDFCKLYKQRFDLDDAQYTSFLKELFSSPVSKRFPDFPGCPVEMLLPEPTNLASIVQEILQSHAIGIHFREENAGVALDSKMQDHGFDVDIYFLPETGFVSGGNRFNCGTWMDKMGESKLFETWGQPATPRDGADVEIIGLLASTVRWIVELSSASIFPYTGVILSPDGSLANEEGVRLSYVDWYGRLKASFEPHFYVPSNPSDDSRFKINKQIVNHRGIYKDSVGNSEGWPDYQLRPNFLVAMVVAPELFDATHAARALSGARQLLKGPLGMKTLDPADWGYRGDYDNKIETDRSTAKGFNYHQGPEWLWPMGFYLRALLQFRGDRKKEVISEIYQILHPHIDHIGSSPYLGLPELTNTNGRPCADSCPTQAWSASVLLDVLFDVSEASLPATSPTNASSSSSSSSSSSQ